MTSQPLKRDYNIRQIQDNYSSVAWFYDFWAKLTESRAAATILELADMDGQQKVLEIAVGTGILFEKIVRINQLGYTTGFDLSPAMLHHARQRVKEEQNSNYSLQIGSAYTLHFQENTFDILINNFMLDLLPERDYSNILKEYRRVLKPEGKVLISTMTFGNRWYHRMWQWIAKTFPRLMTNCRPVSIGTYLEKAGFQIGKHEFVSQNTFPSDIFMATDPG